MIEFRVNAARFLIFLFLATSLSTVICADPEVTIPLGTIRGRRVYINDNFVDEFLGVPYAKPPIGDLRFARPQPITEKWKSPYIAQTLPVGCAQKSLTPISEDCLFLNVYTSENQKKVNVQQPLKPVLFWIHGGGFQDGASRQYNGSILAKLSNCIVVTINYRLSIFGFLFGNSDDIPGNVGLYDQLLALKWVNQNIAYFGGNKNQVTIFGESAGGWSVSLHLMSPLSRPYYKHAIVMSGLDMDYLALDNKDWAIKRAKVLATVVGCPNTSHPQSLPSDVIKCLQEKDTSTLLKATEDKRVVFATQTLMWAKPFLPIFGEPFLPSAPRDIWKTKNFKENTSLLIGTVYNEFLFTSSIQPQQKPTDIIRWFCAKFAPPEFLTKSDCDEFIHIYYTGIDEVNDHQRAVQTVSDLYNDVIFHCPSLTFAEAFSDINPVYQYFFNYKSKSDNPGCGPKYPCHGSDVPFTFGWIRNPDDLVPTLFWIRIISDFAKTGKAFWPQYYRTSLNKLVPVYYEFTGGYLSNGTQIALKNYNCQIWKSFLIDKQLKNKRKYVTTDRP